MSFPITEHHTTSARHRTAYLRCGPDTGPLIVLVHGWPERAISWRHQFAFLADLGYLVLAPDMRGYGDSTVYPKHSDYAMEPIVQDMLELLASLGRNEAIWVGHDWGSPVVWSLASHHPQHCVALASLCVPYAPEGFTLQTRLPLIDRTIYPAEQFPAGQWEYFLFYREQFAKAQACMEANVPNTVRAMFRRGRPDGKGKPAILAYTRIHNGWFMGQPQAPSFPMDDAILDEASMNTYIAGLQKNGFFGPNSYYMNDEPNTDYARRSVNGARLSMPVLFMHAAYDYVCETIESKLAEPMRGSCDDLSECTVASGHWMAQERPAEVNAELAKWLSKLRHKS